MSEKLPKSLVPALYAWQLHAIQVVARASGYALAVHGSLGTDLDLIAVPWTKKAVSHRTLAKRVRDAVEGSFRKADPSPKPHGRLVYTIFMHCDYYIDLSVMPKE